MKLILYTILIVTLVGCKKFVNIDPPKTELVPPVIFASDAAAKQAIAGLYAPLLTGYASGDNFSISYLAGLSSDELIPGSDAPVDFYYNAMHPNNTAVLTLWQDPYKEIYNANAMLEGLNAATAVTPALKQQLSGEAMFLRAFSYFYLVNLYGNVPLNLSTDYRLNQRMPRTSKELVYNQIITDLKTAQKLLSADYYYSDNERVRVNKWVATALLARVYLYRGLWTEAITQAGIIINNTALFKLCPLNTVFLKNSTETIWQLSRMEGNSYDALTFINQLNATLSNAVVTSFENGDKRRSGWIGSSSSGGNTVYWPTKYKATAIAPVTEYSTVFRLAEQYLIRAEAKTQLGNITGVNSAASDLDTIRSRAGLSVTTATTREEMLKAIEKGRVCEFFTEWGHRWLDLKRSESFITAGNTRADDLLKVLKVNWQSTDMLYPIPQEEMRQNPASTQNPGYN
jgi:starch-binding outer membrane protein, SusD/RagB family